MSSRMVKARVINGRLILDEPTELSDGSTVEIDLSRDEDGACHGSRVTLRRSLERSVKEAEAGGGIAWEDFKAELDAKHGHSPPRESSDGMHVYRALEPFDRWVSDNNVSPEYEHEGAWWGYVERIRSFAHKFHVDDVRVIGHYVVDTPPPEERLPMPAVAIVKGGVTVSLKWDFGARCRWPNEWTVSVQRRSPYHGPIFGLFDPSQDLREVVIEGLQPDRVFGPFGLSPAEFTCDLEDEWDVAMLMRLVFHER